MGDVFELNTSIPFSSRDTYVLESSAGYLDKLPDVSVLDEVSVVPNPYVAANISETNPF